MALSRSRALALKLAFALVLTEVLLQVLAAASPPIAWLLTPIRTGFVDDPELGQRGDPANPRHDARGFSNVAVPEQAQVLALGDSQTYGISVAREEAWPQLLAEVAGTTVYNSGIPAGGPVQYRVAGEQAMPLKPQTVLVAVYLGNDLADAFRDAYVRGLGADLLDPARAAEIAALEAEGPILDHLTDLFRKANGRKPDGAWEWFVKRVVARVRTLGLAAAVVRAIGDATKDPPLTGDAAWARQLDKAAQRAGYVSVVEHERARTILTAPYRAAAMDLEDPRLAEGLALTERAIARLHDRCTEASCTVAAVLIPTKELVFAPLLADRAAHVELETLILREDAARAALVRRLGRLGVRTLDALPALQEQLLHGDASPYDESPDGHPNAVGNRAIAEWLAPQLAGLRP